MVPKNNFIRNIPIPVPERKIYSRLGHNRHLNCMSESQKNKIEDAVSEGVSLCRISGVWKRFEIKSRDEAKIVFGRNYVFESKKLAKLLANSDAVLLFAVTAGNEIVETVAKLGESGDGVKALIFDAVGSEMVDAAAGWMQKYLNQKFKRKKEVITKRRFSPGYGDLGLKNQLLLFKLLDIEKLGVKLTDDFIMLPEKSVTAIAGIEKIN